MNGVEAALLLADLAGAGLDLLRPLALSPLPLIPLGDGHADLLGSEPRPDRLFLLADDLVRIPLHGAGLSVL